MSSVNLSGVPAVISARSLDLLIHEGLESSIVLGPPALFCQVGIQYERVISLSRGTVHRKREVLDSSPFSKHRGVIPWHPHFFPSSSVCLLSYASDLRHVLCCCFFWCLTISSGSKCLGVWLLEWEGSDWRFCSERWPVPERTTWDFLCCLQQRKYLGKMLKRSVEINPAK